ncbi:hypothetical protein PS943_03402 [Pseudomonas fluorescens]|jgi:predicted Rossmann-fold nucleotide-binding protein|uniref:Uncharacterized protein n=1 Tax=Pseudomonas fluorescens TaxID=294 RepID=A0A5E7WER2_PSEFL|nr:hypothetical protein PS943_03402 [Pseudomonas fluorescens]
MPTPPPLRSLAVFSGSNFGFNPEYVDGAQALGREIAKRGIRLVYGGTNKVLMGVMADAVLAEFHENRTQQDADLPHRSVGAN